ncbi:hypothetical protein HAX54_034721 [Datura stramonium]|uniref:Uncharacterized protein n=1 Tax=Datura stramonium TaxID=4076 RepID=A0ABS8VFM3_DATST|nr:hypothetical protein [Datura stramonium]
MPPKCTASYRNITSAEVFIGTNTSNLHPKTRMQTRNGAHSICQDASVGAQTVPANTIRTLEAFVPHPPCASTSDAKFRGAILMLTQLVSAQLGRQGSAPTSSIFHDSSGVSRTKDFS